MPVEEVLGFSQRRSKDRMGIGENYHDEIHYYNSGIWWVCFLTLAILFAVSAPGAYAYDQYSANRNATNCRACHGDFRASNYVSLMDGQSWGNLHDLHRNTMLNGDCNVCHVASGRFPVPLDVSSGGSGLQAISCMGCHGRSQDAGHDGVSGGLGAGLRQHHTNAGVAVCAGCHSDANPSNYKPVGENVKPPYYANPGTGHAGMPTDPCNLNGKENFAGASLGLNNDGDTAHDRTDPDCRKAPSDFDGDKKTDLGVWRQPTGFWYIQRSTDNGMTSRQWGLGSLGDTVVSGDFDGDLVDDIAVWRPSTGYRYILQSSNNVMVSHQWGIGTLGDVPVPGDYDGDGKTDVGVWRKSSGIWYIHRSSDDVIVTSHWGNDSLGDIPVPGDYDGDGKTDIAVWRPSNGYWFIQRSTVGVFDYDDYPGNRSPELWGMSTDIPVPGDYDGDGKADIAVWRPTTGYWYILRSSNGSMLSRQWGTGPLSDMPINSNY